MQEDKPTVTNKQKNGSFDAFLTEIIHIEERKKQDYPGELQPYRSLDKEKIPFTHKKSRNLLRSFRFACQGLIYTFKHERNMRIHSGCAMAALSVGGIMRFTGIEMAFLFFAIIIVLLLELVNTALELTLDYTHGSSLHPLVKVIKDIVAGGVLLASLNAVVVGGILFFRHIM